MAVYAQLISEHLQDAILQWRSTVLVFHEHQVILSTLDVHDPVLLTAVKALTLQTSMPRQLNDLLLGNHHGVVVVEASKIYMLQCVIVLVDLVKDAPRYIKLDPLAHGIQLVPVVLILLLTSHLIVVRAVRIDNHNLFGNLLIKF